MRIRPCPKNKPALQPVSLPSARYTRVQNRLSRPIVCRTCIRHRTYSTEVTSETEQSPASSHNTLVHCAHALNYYTKRAAVCQEKICDFVRKFLLFFVQAAWVGSNSSLATLPAGGVQRPTARRAALRPEEREPLESANVTRSTKSLPLCKGRCQRS